MKKRGDLRHLLAFILFLQCGGLFGQTFQAGNSYFDPTGYVEYIAGNLPVIISVPHGGYLEPASIPDRSCTGCSYARDSYTQEIGRGMSTAFFNETGCYPHVIINLLHRKKLDANRDIGDAADGDPTAEQAWYNYHEFIDSAKAEVVRGYGRGLFLDLHGHAHTIQRIELGYLLSGADLRLADSQLNTSTHIEESSIRTLVGDNLTGLSHSELLRGANSFGSLLDDKGFPCVPSSADPFPLDGEPYFSGGYNTVRHGSRDNIGNIDAIQIECNQDVRFNATLRATLIDSLSKSANQYVDFHYNDQYIDNYCGLMLPVELLGFEAKAGQNGIQLNWWTLSETNNSHFEIQRRTEDGRFLKIGELRGNGFSAELQEYGYMDKAPLDGDNSYRLKQMDFDGSFEYSPVVNATFLGQGGAIGNLYPNPSAPGIVSLDYHPFGDRVPSISIFDMMGRPLASPTPNNPGNGSLQFDFSALEKGVYILKIETTDKIAARKLIIE